MINEQTYDDEKVWLSAVRRFNYKTVTETGAGETYGDIGDHVAVKAVEVTGVDMQAEVVGTWSKSDQYGWLEIPGENP